jgi:hypothetical protein
MYGDIRLIPNLIKICLLAYKLLGEDPLNGGTGSACIIDQKFVLFHIQGWGLV